MHKYCVYYDTRTGKCDHHDNKIRFLKVISIRRKCSGVNCIFKKDYGSYGQKDSGSR